MKEDKKCLGIWLDHGKAHLIEQKNGSTVMETLLSDFSKQEQRIDGMGSTGSRVGENRSSNNEFSKHNKEENVIHYYYKVLADRIKNYDKVLLFGPTTAKNELFNSLKEDHHFEKVDITIESADKMTENQMSAFVKDYFEEKEGKSSSQ